MLAPVLHPFQGAAQHAGGGWHRQFFRIGAIFRSEPTADLRSDDPQRIVFEAQHLQNALMNVVGHLG